MENLPPGVDLWEIPWQRPPPGVQPDFTKKSELLVFTATTVAVMILIQLVFLVIRIFTRLRSRDQSWKIDDWCVLITVILCSTLGAILITGVQAMGRHTWDVSMGYLLTARAQRVIVLQHAFVGVSLYLGKCCLLTMYYRIFGHIDRVRYQIYLTAILAFPLLFSSIFQTTINAPPLGTPWGTPNPKNLLGTRTSLAAGIDSLLVDLIILYIPIPVVSTLRISRRKKFGVFVIFLTGLIAIVADIVLLYFRVELFRQIDVLRYGFIVGTCCVIEITISVICSSMPIAAKFFRVHIAESTLFHSLRSRFSSRSSSKDGDSSHPSSFGGLPSFIKRPAAVKKKPDPYSVHVGMPSTNISMTHPIQMHESGETGQGQNGFLKLEPIVYRDGERVTDMNWDGYKGTESVEESSSSYQESEKSKSGFEWV